MKRKNIIPSFLIAALFSTVVITACTKDAAPAPAAPNYSYNEEFDTLANSFARGWVAKNNRRRRRTMGAYLGAFSKLVVIIVNKLN